jgi:hypothetical protein
VWLLLVLAALGGGAVIGAALGASGTIDLLAESAAVSPGADGASYYECPAGLSLGTLYRGDRVYLTGRDDSGEWVEVRSPRHLDDRVWLRAAHVEADAAVALQVRSCQVPVVAIVDTTTTSSTVAADTTTSTTSTTVADTTTTTVPAAPTVGAVSATNDPMWEGYVLDVEFCSAFGAGYPIRTQVAASVTAPAGVQSVTLLWSFGIHSGSIPMSLSSGQYGATLGPFAAEDPTGVPYTQSLPITVTVRVTDALGRTATAGRTVTLNDCTFG